MATRQLIGSLVLFVLVGVVLFVLAHLVDLERVSSTVSSAGPLAPIAYVALKTLTYVIAPLSGGPLHIIAGTVFGVPLGTLYTLLGDTLGATLNFSIARYFGRAMVTRFVGASGIKMIRHYLTWLETAGSLTRARLFLNPVFDLVSYAAGFTTLRFRNFLLITIIAGVPPTLLFVGVGASLREKSLARFVLYGALILAFTVPFFYARRKINSSRAAADQQPRSASAQDQSDSGRPEGT